MIFQKFKAKFSIVMRFTKKEVVVYDISIWLPASHSKISSANHLKYLKS
jgi:hypothetical protein